MASEFCLKITSEFVLAVWHIPCQRQPTEMCAYLCACTKHNGNYSKPAVTQKLVYTTRLAVRVRSTHRDILADVSLVLRIPAERGKGAGIAQSV
jgi:hypothetical protein